jgi:hypothetical protein
MADMDKKARDLNIIKEFCGLMGWRVVSLRPHERPDAFVTFDRDGQRLEVGLELTDYHSDPAEPGGAPSRVRQAAWDQLDEEIRRRVRTRPELHYVSGVVSLKGSSLPPKREASSLAEELVRFAAEAIAGRRCPTQIGYGRPAHAGPFGCGYPLMDRYISCIWLLPTSRRIGPWICSRVQWGSTGFDPRIVRQIVVKKEEAAAGYNWGTAPERWLLIVAGADPCVAQNWVGPKLGLELELKRAACGPLRNFDRVFFYERVAGWWHELFRREGLREIPCPQAETEASPSWAHLRPAPGLKTPQQILGEVAGDGKQERGSR